MTTELEDWQARAKSLFESIERRRYLVAKQEKQGQFQRPAQEKQRILDEMEELVYALWQARWIMEPNLVKLDNRELDQARKQFYKDQMELRA